MTISKEKPKSSVDLDFEEAWEQLVWKPSNDNVEKSKTPEPSPRKKNRSPRKKVSARKGQEERSWRDDVDKENQSQSPRRSQGISAKNFHRKRLSTPKREKEANDLKQTIEENVLSQEKITHKKELEDRRKAFRQITSLKTWPVQGVAIEHLDHLHADETSLSQFHGGDYLSSESASSTGSTGQPKRRPANESSKPTISQQESSRHIFDESKEPLWSQEPRIFATEKSQGKRKYLVGHFGRIADWYWRKCVNKHLYEVIREKVPCRMYFDLEYSKIYNEDVDEEALLLEFREELCTDLLEHLDVKLTSKQIIDLDSSTDAKFSRHWIIDVDSDGLFQDAPTVGRFIKRLVGRLAEELATNQLESRRPTLAKHLFVKTKDPNKTSCFIDLGVYTRNRLFRCFGSSKFGKPNRLLLAETNEYPMEVLPTISKVETEESESAFQEKQTQTFEEYVTANDWEPHARVLASTLVVPLGDPAGKRIFCVEEDVAGPPKPGGSTSVRAFSSAVPIQTRKTPFPKLDTFVLNVLACRGGVQGAIRAWSMEYGGPREDIPVSITYQLCRNRFCELVGRPHKSNNIFWTIVFDGWSCIQGCHDPDCFGRGSPVPIQDEHLREIKEEFESWQDEEFEKALLSLNLDDVENHNPRLPEQTTSSSRDTVSQVKTTKRKTEQSPIDSSSKVLASPKKESDDDLENSSFSLSDEALLAAIEAEPELFP